MADINNHLGISPGESTDIRDITAPALGDEYLDSYYDILVAAEKNTIHFAQTQANLPTPGEYDELIGVAKTVRSDSSQRTLHYYDGENWVDTFGSEIISDIESRITATEDDIGDVSKFNADDLSSQVSINESAIDSLETNLYSSQNIGGPSAKGYKLDWDTDFAFFGLVDNGSDSKDVAIANGQPSDDFLFYSAGEQVAKITGIGDLSARSAAVEADLTARNIELDNIELDSGYVGGQDGGLIGYDASTGFFVDYGNSGGGVGKGLGVLLDSSNLQTGANLSISGGESNDSRPRLSAPSIGDVSKFSAGDLSSQVSINESDIDSLQNAGKNVVISFHRVDIGYDNRVECQVEIVNVGTENLSSEKLEYGNRVWSWASDWYESLGSVSYSVEVGMRTIESFTIKPTALREEAEIYADTLDRSVYETITPAIGSVWKQDGGQMPDIGYFGTIEAAYSKTDYGNVRQVLDVRGEWTDDGVIVDTYRPNGGDNQQFTLVDPEGNEDDNVFFIQAKHSSKNLTLGYHDDATSGRTLVQTAPNEDDDMQKWRFHSTRFEHGEKRTETFIIQNVRTNQILEYAPEPYSAPYSPDDQHESMVPASPRNHKLGYNVMWTLW